ncbi:hypothetical protein BMEII0182 [Brucella melitensis bv. 1 str. 16M]|uniref:Uncharacterized protein n=1 Tax=Brucella melitensis biotype 1 (strain ATCC 23456 / CCUG 17765 / NCTC 10094 / 16M) TaxID=224914 RepID=Q8YDJ3_BRUME|nr:hypothetical protein BMEII0182 [Brucella melitensis bv. 1 str. 16M]
MAWGHLSYVRRNLVESRRLMVEIGLKWTIWSVERKFFFFRETPLTVWLGGAYIAPQRGRRRRQRQSDASLSY